METESNEKEKLGHKNDLSVSTKSKPKYFQWLRSEPMSLCQLFLQSESTYACVNLLGELGMTQFRDLNPDFNAFQRKFVNEMRRCDEMERKLNYFETEVRKDGVPILEYGDEPGAPEPREMVKLEAQLEKLESDLIEVNNSSGSLKKTYLELTELRYILKKTGLFFEETQEKQKTRNEIRRLSVVDPRLMRRFSAIEAEINIPQDPVVDINFIAGTIRKERFHSFERMLWRLCRGNIFLRQVDIEERLEDPKTGEMQYKCIFIIVFQGEQLKTRCKKICEGFNATLYPCPERPAERNDMHAGVVNRIEDLQVVIKQTTEHKSRILVALAKNLLHWKVVVRKVKSIYDVMNCFSVDITSKCLIAECWCPNLAIPEIQEALAKAQKLSDSSIPSVLTRMTTSVEPPTFNATNKFTSGFQGIVDAYGVGNYGEVNPMPFTIVTFPFLFAVMFGDVGHGLIMALFGLWMVLKEKSLSKNNWGEIWDTFFNGRYIILLMGLFSIYTGFIYNDIFSKSMNLFRSNFFAPELNTSHLGSIGEPHRYEKLLVLDPQTESYNDPYPFGMDPIWQVAHNKILFLNTYKMKTSVILGVIQMLFGVFLSVINHIHFKNWINILVEFIPQVLFLMCIFGYMNFMIIYKWFVYSSVGSNCAPSILITLINMFMMKKPADTDPCYLREWMYTGQDTVQLILLLVAVLCIPCMLLIKPFYLKHKHQKKSKLEIAVQPTYQNTTEIEMTNKTNSSKSNGEEVNVSFPESSTSSDDTHEVNKGGHGGHDGDGEFDFGDTFVHQAIHTIEYCLGSISHTASYLRLWALSLAHSQLSEVLWNMIFTEGFIQIGDSPELSVYNIGGGIIMYVIFSIWAVLTICILLLMEGLSAFLHALRLHWVEFQSKFYSGAGYGFLPFSFKLIIKQLNNPES